VDRHDAARHQVGDEFIEMSFLQRLDRHFTLPVAQWLQTIAVGGLGPTCADRVGRPANSRKPTRR
jgi:hypothetical protein